MTAFPVMPLSAMKTLRALAHETRWRIGERLLEHSLCADGLAEILQLPRTSVSDHLQIMRRAGLLNSEGCGRRVLYRATHRFSALLPALRRVLGISERTDPILGADAWNAGRSDG